MKQFKVRLIGIGTAKDGWRNIHANSAQEAFDKATQEYKGRCEVIDVKENKKCKN